MRQFLRALALAALVATPAAGGDEGPSLAGTWYGHDYQPVVDEFLQRITYQLPDGTFSVEFRQYTNCQLQFQQTESGTWSQEGNMETKVTTSIDGQPVDFVDTYEILELTETTLRKRHNQSGAVFTSDRVAADFEFPSCEEVT